MRYKTKKMKITKEQLKEIIKEEVSKLQKKTILENRKKEIVKELRILSEEAITQELFGIGKKKKEAAARAAEKQTKLSHVSRWNFKVPYANATSKDYEREIEMYEKYIEEEMDNLNPNASNFDTILSNIQEYDKALEAISKEINHSELPNKEELKSNILRIIKDGDDFIYNVDF